jgi:Ca2+-binding EF-hand superfamily protein
MRCVIITLVIAAVHASTTAFDQWMDKNETKWVRSTDAIFKSLDGDHDGYVVDADFKRVFNGSKFESVVFEFDLDRDGRVSKREFREGIRTIGKNTPVDIDPQMCEQAENVTKKCTKKWSSKQRRAARLSAFRAMCRSEIPAIDKYPVEHCVINADGNCDTIHQCYTGSATASLDVNHATTVALGRAILILGLASLLVFPLVLLDVAFLTLAAFVATVGIQIGFWAALITLVYKTRDD